MRRLVELNPIAVDLSPGGALARGQPSVFRGARTHCALVNFGSMQNNRLSGALILNVVSCAACSMTRW
jgi:hypothetical protein